MPLIAKPISLFLGIFQLPPFARSAVKVSSSSVVTRGLKNPKYLVPESQEKTLGLFEDEPVRKRLTPAQQRDIVLRAGKCSECGEDDSSLLQVHHIKPFAKGGS